VFPCASAASRLIYNGAPIHESFTVNFLGILLKIDIGGVQQEPDNSAE
jgi:hypothetical protein